MNSTKKLIKLSYINKYLRFQISDVIDLFTDYNWIIFFTFTFAGNWIAKHVM